MTETYAGGHGIRLWTLSSGSGVPVVVCSGGPGCCDYLAPIASMLDRTAQVIRFDHRGCGRSDPAPVYNVETSLEDLEIIRQHYGVERWVVAGHSWGACVALAYALQYPERVHGFVCLAGGLVHTDREWHHVYEQRREQGLEPPLDFDYPPNLEVNAQINQAWKQYIQRPSLLKEIAILERPALFLYGEHDIRPSWPVEQVARLLPNARFEMFAGANHYLWLTHAGVMQTMLQEFVRRVADSSCAVLS
jgi:proline iminopeptidase